MKRHHPGEKGAVIVTTVLLILVVAALCYAFLTNMVSLDREHHGRTEQTKALYVAEAGTSVAAIEVLPALAPGESQVVGGPDDPVAFEGGTYWLEATAHADGSYTLLAHATHARTSLVLETRWERALHAIRDHAIFSGNLGHDPTHDLEFGGTGKSADVVDGKVYAAGSVTLRGGSAIHGDVTATGVVSGVVDGDVVQNAPRIEPPDLAAMKYDEIADFRIDATARFDSKGRLPASDPRHIFVKEFRSDLATSRGFRFDNTNYFLGDPWEAADLTRISVPEAGNNKIYYVDGNLWVEPQGTEQRVVKSPPAGTVITIVVKGNVYISDTLRYDASKDGILFVAMTDGESYNDRNGNNQYDAGEPLLHDDGDGVYEGPSEGSGNVHFGDPNGGPLGHVQAFMYADNHFEDHVLEGTGKSPLPFDVTGFMSAGEEVRINRDFGTGHARMGVKFDSRIVDGTLSFPGFPEAAGRGPLRQISWRIVGDDAP